jgi:hypothetical protein
VQAPATMDQPLCAGGYFDSTKGPLTLQLCQLQHCAQLIRPWLLSSLSGVRSSKPPGGNPGRQFQTSHYKVAHETSTNQDLQGLAEQAGQLCLAVCSSLQRCHHVASSVASDGIN